MIFGWPAGKQFLHYSLPVFAHMISLRIAAVESNEAGIAGICSGLLCASRHGVLGIVKYR